ncbi:SMI1/KNR4 family protein [Paenibacillus sp. 1011MAR3C5]|uniref:SMI1/KNR4 family protein n=1 Tax=Paenibacillus sp. 1011MAR3C5 TaxID=1675787 RepID=UPI000E6BDF1A|nr:SMI1/KNR4 family protein [Paenibacillus sp. 1011MAR3C5]RJE86282.1 SMI1/KNR4 family protein [Paenibacillus sp. 1011MAR3C5]
MNQALMERLTTFLHREDNSTLAGTPASQEEVDYAEQRLGVSFHEDYVQFIRTFGGAYAGIAVHAFSNGSSIGRETVTDMTLEFREQCKELPCAEVLQKSYVISMDGSGDPIFINPAGEVLISYHDTGELKVLASSFEELIQDNFYEW